MATSTTAFIAGYLGTTAASTASTMAAFIATTSAMAASAKLQSYCSSIDCSCSAGSFIEIVVLRRPSSCSAAGTRPYYG